MTKSELEGYRRQLRAWQHRNVDESHLTDKAVHIIPDPATITFEQQFMDEVTAALERIEKGTFGWCEECGRTIAVGRLEVLPYSRFCIECVLKLQSIKEMKR